MGVAIAYADQLLDREFDEAYMQLHTGEPGPDCIGNVAQTAERIQVAFGAAEGGTIVSLIDAEWDEAAADEQVTHASLWTRREDGMASVSGPFIDPIVLEAGSPFTVPAGWLSVTFA